MARAPNPDTILVARSPGETRYALLAGEEVVSIVHRRDSEIQPGAVYLGRTGSKIPGVDGVFVHFGATAPGVLATKKPPPEGAAVMVTVVVPPRGGKGAALKSVSRESPQSTRAPALVSPAPDPLADWYGPHIQRIVAAPRREVVRVRAVLGDDAPVESHGGFDLFAAYGVEAAIEAALRPEVPLPSGGSIMIETTAAVTAIDVNSGAGDPVTANHEAMTTVARELRRRNLAGHIVIDVIPTRRNAALPRLLTKALEGDSVVAKVAGMTPLGMIELTRQRVGLSLAETLGDAALTAAYRALRAAVTKGLAENRTQVNIAAAPAVIAHLRGPLRKALSEAGDILKCEIGLDSRADFQRDRAEVLT